MRHDEMTPATQVDVYDGWELAYAAHTDESLWDEQPICVMPQTLEMLQSHGAASVLELGCGDGRNLQVLAAEGYLCTGVDIAPTGLQRAHARLQQAGLHAFFCLSDISQLPFADHTADALTVFDVFGQLPDPAAFAREAQRVLKPGGVMALNAFTPGDAAFGHGDRVEERAYLYQGTLFRFFERDELVGHFAGWGIRKIELVTWNDPPHGAFRTEPHRHESWYLEAVAPLGETL